MFYRLLATITKEMITFWRDPKIRGVLIGIPIVELLLFAYAATMDVRNIEVAVINDDAGRWSHELIARVEAASFVDSVVIIQTMDELTELIENREVLLGLRFGSDYSRNVAANRSATAQVLIDGRRANAGQISAAYLNTIAAQLGQELSAKNLQPRSQPTASVRHWFNPNLQFRWFIVPDIGATLAMITAFLMTTLAIAREREMGTFEQLLVSPSTTMEILVGKSIPAILAGMFVGVLVMTVGVFWFDIPYAGSLGWYLFSMLVFLFSVVSVGLIISTLSQTQQQAVLGSIFTVMPIMLVSGIITPIDNMPQWLQYGAELNPLKHFLVIVQGSYLKSMNTAQLLDNIWPMAVIGGVSMSVATMVLNRRLH